MDLKARWKQLSERLGVPNAASLYGLIETKYSEPHRAYHNLTHIDDCVTKCTQYAERELGKDKTVALELALWFHDIVYNPMSATNEEDSVTYMEKLLEPFGTDRNLLDDAADLITLTKSHEVPRGLDQPAWFMHDIDLSVLGADPEIFWRYELAIRKEYSFVPPEVYGPKRVEILMKFRGLCDVDFVLYKIPLLSGLWNNQARQNLRHACSYLRAAYG